MMQFKPLLITAAVATSILMVGASAQKAPYVSKIRQAAIDKLQTKLGTIRGSIKLRQKRVYLTETMIDQLKPINSGEVEKPKFDYAQKENDTYASPLAGVIDDPYRISKIEKIINKIEAETIASDQSVTAALNEKPVKENDTDAVIDVPELEQDTAPSNQQEIAPPRKPVSTTSLTRSQRLQREIFKAVTDPLSTQKSITTNSLDTPTLPDEADMKELMDAVDRVLGPA